MDVSRGQYLIDQHFNGALTNDEAAELSQLLLVDAELREAFWHAADLSYALHCALETEAGGASDTSVVLRAPRRVWQAIRYAFTHHTALSIVISCLINGALVLGLALWLVPKLTPRAAPPASQSVATITATRQAVWKNTSDDDTKNKRLLPGETLWLKSGFAEVTFGDGTIVVLEGPATFSVATPNTGTLGEGRLVARSVAGQHGFTVFTPLATIIDLGTEFGVKVDASGATETSVFVGRVSVEPGRTEATEIVPSANTPPPGQIVVAGKTVQLSAARPRHVEPVAKSATSYYRIIPDAARIPIFSTGAGAGAAIGQADAHWEIVSASHIPQFVPQAAVVTAPDPSYAPQSSQAHWISHAANGTAVDGMFTFRTTFDLAGLDAASARLDGAIAADNSIVAMRLNGRELKVPEGTQLFKRTSFSVRDHFVSGMNELEIVVANDNSPSLMALLLEIGGTANRLRSGDIVKP